MPAVSQMQREALNAKFGHQWVKAHHFDNKGKLPKYAHKGPWNAEHLARNMKRRKK